MYRSIHLWLGGRQRAGHHGSSTVITTMRCTRALGVRQFRPRFVWACMRRFQSRSALLSMDKPTTTAKKRKYIVTFTADDRAKIGKYATENGNAASVKRFKVSHNIGEPKKRQNTYMGRSSITRCKNTFEHCAVLVL